ncbi:MAG TPA: alpha/beta hydrolase, partial [Acidimicrobiales bacterium]|nr:alpha/beta hydrolase [Acidimicrobiales bacterium]
AVVGEWEVYGRHLTPDATPAGSVVVVHGMVVAGMGIRPLARELVGRGLAVHVPDLPGFGRSGKPRRALDVDGLADALAGWMAVSGLEGSSLLGNSFGTQVAVAAVERHPDLTGPLALLSPTIDRRFRRGWAGRLPPGRPGGRPASGVLGWVQRQAVERLLPADEQVETPSLRSLLLTEYAAAGPARALSTYRHALRDDIAGRLVRVANPVLVLRGERDGLVSPEWARSLAGLAGGRYAEIAGADHDAQYHRPHAVADAVVAHLTGGSSR